MAYALTTQKIEWILDKHRSTHHYYDKYLPYEFHLRMVVEVCIDFKHLLNPDLSYAEAIVACWGHDLIEDTRTSYNDCKDILEERVADIIYAVSNEKGKNRKERANDKYYQGIRNTPGAVFVKLCDRIANVQYSKLTKSSMFEKYKKENLDFVKAIYDQKYEPMFDYLHKLFN